LDNHVPSRLPADILIAQNDGKWRVCHCNSLSHNTNANDFICRVLASAVVVPEQDLPAESTSLKRRQSDLTESPTDSKRARLSPEDQRNEQQGQHDSRPDAPVAKAQDELEADDDKRTIRRRTGRDEERKRGQRMFGALLGTLSAKGNGSSTAAKRRADIEKRQAEKLKQLEQDVSQREREQAEELMRTRRKEQWLVDAAAVSNIGASLMQRTLMKLVGRKTCEFVSKSKVLKYDNRTETRKCNSNP
jgi:hypothetical protein